MIALAAEASGFGFMQNGYWYPGNAGQIFFIFAFSILFTFMGSFWFGLAFRQRPMRVWMAGAFKATIAWLITILGALIIPITLYGLGVPAFQNKVVGGMKITPYMAESISGILTFGLTIIVMISLVAFFRSKAASWFLKYE